MANLISNFLYSARSYFLAGGLVFHHPHTSLKASVKSVTAGEPAFGARTKQSGVAAAAGATLDFWSSPLSRRWAASGRIVASGHSGAQLSEIGRASCRGR